MSMSELVLLFTALGFISTMAFSGNLKWIRYKNFFKELHGKNEKSHFWYLKWMEQMKSSPQSPSHPCQFSLIWEGCLPEKENTADHTDHTGQTASDTAHTGHTGQWSHRLSHWSHWLSHWLSHCWSVVSCNFPSKSLGRAPDVQHGPLGVVQALVEKVWTSIRRRWWRPCEQLKSKI